jgi:hypothetical protein
MNAVTDRGSIVIEMSSIGVDLAVVGGRDP